MKKHLFITFLAIISFYFINCKSVQTLPDQFKGRQIIFGSGGGFTGEWEMYYILEDGNLYFKKSYANKYSLIKNLGNKTKKSVYNKFDEVDFENVKFNKQGNMSYSIEYVSEDIRHKVIWGNFQNPPPKKIQELYDFLNKLYQ